MTQTRRKVQYVSGAVADAACRPHFAQMTLVPIGVPTMLALFILLLRRSTFYFILPMAFSGKFLLK